MSVGGMLHNILFFVIAIGVLVTIHEFGHYWIARLLKVKVLRFSVGFGKPLITWRKKHGDDEIEYVIAALPLGGYVKMLDEREAEVDENEKHRAFNTQPVWNRVAIVAAGPIFNFILAIALYWLVFLNGEEGRKPLLDVPEPDSIAAISGFQADDEVLMVADQQIRTWQDFRMALIDEGIDGGEISIKLRNVEQVVLTRALSVGDRHILNHDSDVIEQLGFKPWQPDLPPVIGGVTETGAARKAGLTRGDRIIAINGNAIQEWQQLVDVVQSEPDKNIEFLIERDAKEVFVTVHTGVRKKDGKDSGFIGAYQYVPDEVIDKLKTKIEYNPLEALVKAVDKTWSMSILTLRVLGKMLLGEAALENISGPITIATYAGMTASIGFVTYIGFLAIISVSLGVLNLLPVPMLDGGHLFYYLIEMIKGSPVSEKFEELGQQVGLALLLMLMGLAIFNDIQRLVN